MDYPERLALISVDPWYLQKQKALINLLYLDLQPQIFLFSTSLNSIHLAGGDYTKPEKGIATIYATRQGIPLRMTWKPQSTSSIGSRSCGKGRGGIRNCTAGPWHPVSSSMHRDTASVAAGRTLDKPRTSKTFMKESFRGSLWNSRLLTSYESLLLRSS